MKNKYLLTSIIAFLVGLGVFFLGQTHLFDFSKDKLSPYLVPLAAISIIAFFVSMCFIKKTWVRLAYYIIVAIINIVFCIGLYEAARNDLPTKTYIFGLAINNLFLFFFDKKNKKCNQAGG